MIAGHAVAECLRNEGVRHVFCVPGESYLAVMSELHDDPVLHLVTCRHEGGAAFMALADAKLTGRTGVVFASRGPGATNASIAAHSAEQGAQPMLLLLGQVGTGRLGRNATQEMNFAKTFADIAKSVEEVHDPAVRLLESFEVLARIHAERTGNTLEQQLVALTTIPRRWSQVVPLLQESNASYPQGAAEIADQLEERDLHWRSARPADPLIVSVRSNDAAQALTAFRAEQFLHRNVLLTDRHGALVAAQGDAPRQATFGHETWWRTAYAEGEGGWYIGDLDVATGTGVLAMDGCGEGLRLDHTVMALQAGGGIDRHAAFGQGRQRQGQGEGEDENDSGQLLPHERPPRMNMTEI